MITALRTLAVTFTFVITTSIALSAACVVADQTARPTHPAASAPFKHLTFKGTTKPPGAALDHRLGSSTVLSIADKRLGQFVSSAICTGC